MITPYSLGKTTWVDVLTPTKEEITGLIERYSLDARIGEDLLSPTPHTVVARYDAALHAVLHFPALRQSHSKSHKQEIDVVMTNSVVITCRYDTIDAIEALAREAEVAEIHQTATFNHSSELAGWILLGLYTGFNNEIASFEDTLANLEKPMFSGKEHYVVKELSSLSRSIILCKKTLSAHEYTLQELMHHTERMFGFAGGKAFREVMQRHTKISSRLETVGELLLGIRDTNNSLLSLRQQSTMQALTFITVIVGALLVLFDLFTLGTLDDFIPFTEHDKVVALAGYIIFTGFSMLVARSKRWI